jgi:predicted nucleic acid-binding protein
MKYVIDRSMAVKWVVPETDSDKADRLRDAFQKAVHELLAPDVFSLELAHALTSAERQGRIPVGQAAVLWADVLAAPPRLFPSGALTPRAIAISSTVRIGVYDCLYVALAEREWRYILVLRSDRIPPARNDGGSRLGDQYRGGGTWPTKPRRRGWRKRLRIFLPLGPRGRNCSLTALLARRRSVLATC